MTMYLKFVAIILMLPPVFSQYILPATVVLRGDLDDQDTCPSVPVRETTKQSISASVHNILNKTVPSCGQGLWTKVASINMSDPTQQCPSAWREYSTIRSCGRPEGSSGCPSVTFDTAHSQYTKVCGRAIGYQYHSPDAFRRFVSQPTGTPDDNYVDGVSVTHGSNPRKHIWTFAAGLLEPNEGVAQNFRQYACPCAAPDDPTYGTPPPSYVGDNYFCEVGHTDTTHRYTHYTEPLWDGKGCVTSQCCTFNTPPWFSVKLPSSTTDDIEVRICSDQEVGNEDTTIEILELYIQ